MKRIILVAGVDYGFKGANFRRRCENRMKFILNRNKSKENMTFEIFDFRSGEIITHTVTFPMGKKTVRTSILRSFEKITKDKNYIKIPDSTGGDDHHYNFKIEQHNTMSIVDVYAAVKAIGTSSTMANSIIELSIMSHAWHGGPILVNSFDSGSMKNPHPPPLRIPLGSFRDPNDRDPRNRDFVPAVMDVAAFGNAFHTDGIIWIWGCAFFRLLHEILTKIERNKAYKSSGLADDTLFTFKNLNRAQADELERVLSGVIPAAFIDKKNIKIEFKFLKHYICKLTTTSYSFDLAKNSEVKVFAAVIGTYTEGHKGLMRVKLGPLFRKHLRFYENYLGFKFDPERRGYGIIEPDFACS